MNDEDLVATFGQTVGVEKAAQLVDEALEALGMERAADYSSHEIADICETIERENDGYVRVVASEIRVREQAKRRFDALVDELADPVVAVTFEGATPVVKAINPVFEEAFGYGSEAIGEPLPSLIVPGDEEQEDASIDRWLRSDRTGGTEVRRETADGDHRTLLFRPVIVTGFDGSIEGYGIYTDITERKRQERKLEHQNEQLERFVSVVSHDLRSPLTVASGHLELADEATENEAAREHLSAVRESIERMEALLEQLLTLAKRGRVVGEPSRVDLQRVVEDAWLNVRTDGASLVVEDLPVIEADRERLRELLENLFRNAVEHGSTSPASQGRQDAVEHGSTSPRSQAREDAVEHGSTSPSSQTRRTDFAADGDVMISVSPLDDRPATGFAVEDDGPGIPPEEREAVFERGYTTDENGTGFGLSIVRSIVEAHGWSITLTDGEDGGARFEIVCDPVE